MAAEDGPLGRASMISKFVHFLEELGRRRVWRTVFAYAAVVFVLLQLGEIVFPAFEAPDWALRLLVVASFLGLPLVLALAWAFDITRDGIQKTSPDGERDRANGERDPADRERDRAGGERDSACGEKDPLAWSGGTTLPRLTLLVVTILTVTGVGWWAVQDTLEAQAANTQVAGDGPYASASLEESPPRIRSLAVLPLEDYSPQEGGEYFTAGFHEELVSQLGQTGAARVLSRTSVVQYDATGKTMPSIAADLGVEGVVEGSVFRDGNRVRITVQLIHGPSDRHLWANSYDGTLEDAIGLQKRVARAIAREIQAELGPGEEGPTPASRVAANPRVQEEYLKGRYAQAQATPEGLESAIQHFKAAVAEDSSFAPAYAGLAGARLLLGLHQGDSLALDPPVQEEIVEPLEVAFRLDEDLPEARAVLLTLHRSLGGGSSAALPQPVRMLVDSTVMLEAEIALASTEMGRQLERIGGRVRMDVPRNEDSPVLVARRYMQEDRREEAFQALEEAVAHRDRHLATLWADPVWDSVRADPRFRKLLYEARRGRTQTGSGQGPSHPPV